jgi:(E)-4-hydroxy-3-methylbut-2-enyl-diphosphate synthase
MDTIATVEQSIRIIEAGSDYIRITAPALKEAVNLENIKKELRKRGYGTPLIADIHFLPMPPSMQELWKNPYKSGNYADEKVQIFQYTDEMRVNASRGFTPLKICKEYGTAMRIRQMRLVIG